MADPDDLFFDSPMPFTIAPIACSRMPKWNLRGFKFPASKSPAPSNVSRVFVDGYKSAEPPISQGSFLAMALRTLEDESRVARPLASAANVGSSLSHPLAGW